MQTVALIPAIIQRPSSRILFSARTTTLFAATAAALFSVSSSAPTPLYRLYQVQYGLSSFLLTVIFSAYVFGLLGALLTVGRLSDHIGRRPMIFATLALNAAAMILFIGADSAATLIAARLTQGIATGAAMTTLGATILDTDRTNGPVINSVTAFIGLTIGSLGGGLLAAYAPAPTTLVYVILLLTSILMALLVLQMPETTETRPGALASLRPQVSVPAQARKALLAVTPVTVATWALGGFYFSLIPSLIRVATGLSSPLIGGLTVATLMVTGAIAVFVLRNRATATILTVGTSSLALGVAVTLAGVWSRSIDLMLLGTVVAGVGFGAAFSGALRTVLPLASASERAGLLSTFYVESYLAFSLPAIAAGLAAPVVGLQSVTYIYGAVVILLSIVSLAAILMRRSA
jgi:predicted MFS family arabinose efflux permease